MNIYNQFWGNDHLSEEISQVQPAIENLEEPESKSNWGKQTI